MNNLLISETWFEKKDNNTRYGIGDSGVYESRFETPGEVYRYALKEYGRCTGKVYIDRDGRAAHIGWAFQKRRKYDDCNETYLAETWVTIHTAPREVYHKYHYYEIGRD